MAEGDKPDTSSEGLIAVIRRWLHGDEGASTPDVTRVQAAAIAQLAVAVLIVFGFSPSESVRNAILTVATVLAAVLSASDATIRHSRAKYSDRITASKIALALHRDEETSVALSALARPKEGCAGTNEAQRAMERVEGILAGRSLLPTEEAGTRADMDSALRIVRERYARGELTRKEYARLLADLQKPPAQA
ncbi:MAG: hypothetical protein QOJ13_813 [Gaiellales bacterium]|jgi:hypothetical protein|nr:hypothetical protein [Gaiellales bacterium]